MLGQRIGTTALAAVLMVSALSAPQVSAAGPPAEVRLAAVVSAPWIHEVRARLDAGDVDGAKAALDRYLASGRRTPEEDWEAAVLQEIVAGSTRPARAAVAAGSVRPPKPQRSVPKLDAVQVFVFRSPRPEQIDSELAALRASGVDTLIVRAFHNRGDRPLFPGLGIAEPGVYFRSRNAPLAADLLPGLVEKARAQGMRIFAWVGTRKSEWLIEQHPEWLEYQYDPSLGRTVPSKSLSLANPDVRRMLIELAGEAAATGVDGILLQDDLVIRLGEGFSPAAEQDAITRTGRAYHPGELLRTLPNGALAPVAGEALDRWVRWKGDTILRFIGDVATTIRAVKPDILLAVNLFYEALLDTRRGLAWFGQDAAGMTDLADYLAVMSYHRQMRAETGESQDFVDGLLRRVADGAGSLAVDSPRIIFKVQSVDWRDRQPISEEERAAVRRTLDPEGKHSFAVLMN
jgi:biofilm PGA synthesis lipoprotein PgaB